MFGTRHTPWDGHRSDGAIGDDSIYSQNTSRLLRTLSHFSQSVIYYYYYIKQENDYSDVRQQ